MTRQTARRIEGDTAEDERYADLERVRVHTQPDTHAQPSGS